MGWALINFFFLQDGRLFNVGANSRLGAYPPGPLSISTQAPLLGLYIYLFTHALYVVCPGSL